MFNTIFSRLFRSIAFSLVVIFVLFAGAYAQNMTAANDSKSSPSAEAEEVVKNAVKFMGGDKYLGVKTLVGKGRFSIIREGRVISYQTFTDVIVFPDKERTDFKGQGIKTVQTNVGDTGWMFDGDHDRLIDQTETQIANFHRGIRVSLDNLLRGGWKGHAKLSYVEKRPATLGKRNDVVKLTYDDGFEVEFEFSADDAMPRKAIYKSGEETTEMDLYEQFVSVGGIKTPYVIDRRTNDEHTSRINYDSVKFNEKIPDSIFEKPADEKHLKSLKF